MSIIKLSVADGNTAEVHAHGAHVTSWHAAGEERLFMSPRAEFREDAAIRGGVPVIFPQFAGLGPLPKHGFARTARWQQMPADATDSVQFRLQDNASTYAIWPYRFIADYRVEVLKDALRMTLSIRNVDIRSFTFTAALHTYLRVEDISRVRARGLQGRQYLDSAAGGVRRLEAGPELSIAGEVDRIYLSAQPPLQLLEPGRRTVICSMQGFTDVVVWNPGAVKAAQLHDLEPDGFKHMLCVEAAVIGVPVELLPQASWSGTQQLQLV